MALEVARRATKAPGLPWTGILYGSSAKTGELSSASSSQEASNDKNNKVTDYMVLRTPSSVKIVRID